MLRGLSCLTMNMFSHGDMCVYVRHESRFEDKYRQVRYSFRLLHECISHNLFDNGILSQHTYLNFMIDDR
jgi:hypothetical protein